ncbi:putative membrane protein YGL010W [Pedobacter africanus]|uniref:Membrane protein YGL010W n=1 Tax=Pedobacter africanus TaxID=151894 RepID=A0ACC6L2L0_9SPHI|nr:Mpo1-like protein [Pedobacter africanus]MDR6785566.1 putative membrane protein YGL010W [Pedobacter africanus]
MKKEQNKGTGANTKSEVDMLFDKYAESHQNHTNETIHWVCVPLIVFSLLGLVWAIPFPHLEFLGRYNGYVNWASFLIAFSVYYYYRLSPVMSYLMLLLIFGMSILIVQLEKVEAAGGPALWLVCLVIFVLAWIGQFIGHKIEGKKPSFLEDVKFLLIGPIWLLHFICKKVGLRY